MRQREKRVLVAYGIDNSPMTWYKRGMNDAACLLREANAFNNRWKKSGERSFGELADMLTGAIRLKRHAAETAIGIPRGSTRELIIGIGVAARDAEKTIRRQLAAPAYTPDAA